MSKCERAKVSKIYKIPKRGNREDDMCLFKPECSKLNVTAGEISSSVSIMAASDRVHKNMVVTEATHTNEDHTHARTLSWLSDTWGSGEPRSKWEHVERVYFPLVSVTLVMSARSILKNKPTLNYQKSKE